MQSLICLRSDILQLQGCVLITQDKSEFPQFMLASNGLLAAGSVPNVRQCMCTPGQLALAPCSKDVCAAQV